MAPAEKAEVELVEWTEAPEKQMSRVLIIFPRLPLTIQWTPCQGSKKSKQTQIPPCVFRFYGQKWWF
jgi:hypothetical protein